MRKILLKDIVIPAGSIFMAAATKVERARGAFVEHTIGLTDDTAGTLTYEVSDDLSDWFGDVIETHPK